MQEIDARDVAQEVMIHVSKGIEQFRYDPQLGQFRSWLGTITHRVILKHRGKHARRTAATATGQLDWLATVESWQTVGELWLEVFAAHVYRTAVERIRLEFDQETWHVFNEIFVAEESPEKLAGELKRSIGWVYQAKSKVVRRLKQEILILAEDSVLFDLPGFQVTVDKE